MHNRLLDISTISNFHQTECMPSKMPGVNNFIRGLALIGVLNNWALSFYSIILKLGTKKNSSFSKVKKVLKYVYPIKIYNVSKFQFPAILLPNKAKTLVQSLLSLEILD